MRNILWAGIAALGLSGYGCAHAVHEQRMASRSEVRAERAAERGDYDRAAREERKAEEHQARAVDAVPPTPPAPPAPPIP